MVALTTGAVHGAIVVNITQAPTGPVVLGTPLIFTVTMFSNAGTIPDVQSIDFSINADDSLLGGGATSGGRFTAGSSSYFVPGDWQFLPPITGATSALTFAGFVTGLPLTLTGVPTAVATFTLQTTGAIPGIHTITVTDFAATDGMAVVIPVIAAAPFMYSLVALPEPGVITLFGAAGTLLVGTMRRAGVRRK